MSFKEGQRVRLTGRAWGTRGREVYARITYADGGWAKVDDQDVCISGGLVDGFEVEDAELVPITFPRVSRLTIVSGEGLEYEAYGLYLDGVELHLQDDGRTLKVFPRREE